jgi:hypothetical protein
MENDKEEEGEEDTRVKDENDEDVQSQMPTRIE